jgi:O-antigen/teichoic acid export membrane protein
MPAQTLESSHVTEASHKSMFFRQSGWMMISAVAGGALMFAVQVFSKKFLSDPEYSAFVALIQVTNWITIPALGLQMVFAQEAAAAISGHHEQQLAKTIRSVMLWTFCVWLATAIAVFIYRDPCTDALKLSNQMGLWLTVASGLVMVWLQLFWGLLQGRQNFLWYGWSTMFNGVGRVAFGGVIVLALHGQAAGLMLAVFAGLMASFIPAILQNVDLLKMKGAPFDAFGWLKRVVPLTAGFGVSTFIFSADAVAVQNFLGAGGKAADYQFGGTLCRAIVLFTAPLAAVMFPKLVRSAARAQKTNVMGLTLLGTFTLSATAVIGLTLVSPIIMKMFSKGDYQTMVRLIPLFASGMTLMGMGNVLLYNLMAHSRFKIVPLLLVLAASYWYALQHFHDSFKMVIQTFCLTALVYLGLCSLFTWVIDAKKNMPEPA